VLAGGQREPGAQRIADIGVEQIDLLLHIFGIEPPFELPESGAFEAEAGTADVRAATEVIAASALVISRIIDLEHPARLEGEIAVHAGLGRLGGAHFHILDPGLGLAGLLLQLGIARLELADARLQGIEPVENGVGRIAIAVLSIRGCRDGKKRRRRSQREMFHDFLPGTAPPLRQHGRSRGYRLAASNA
jgi:hypothetical protein